eukprot:348785-Rhodomonas_salina.1
MFATITVFVFPPSESCSSRVSFESRYGMWFVFESTSAEITFPSADSDKLILVASCARTARLPVSYTHLTLPTICSV